MFSQTKSFSQSNDGPVEVTLAIEKKINQEISSEAASLKNELTNDKESTTSIEFTLDTFRIERYSEKYMAYDYSTAGMCNATLDAAKKYDSLLNKYYKKLLAVLKNNDKDVLVNAERSWVVFRNNELKLLETLTNDEYSGGGTIQRIIFASEYLDIIKQRALAIYDYYLDVKKGY